MRVTNENGEVSESRSRFAFIRMDSGEVDVSKDTAGEEVSNYRNGSRVEVSGTMYRCV